MKSRFSFIFAAVLCCCASAAYAHAFLQHAQPGAGAMLKPGPNAVVLTFSEKLEPVFSGIAVTDSGGRSVEAAPVLVRGNSVAAPLRPLAPGTGH